MPYMPHPKKQKVNTFFPQHFLSIKRLSIKIETKCLFHVPIPPLYKQAFPPLRRQLSHSSMSSLYHTHLCVQTCVCSQRRAVGVSSLLLPCGCRKSISSRHGSLPTEPSFGTLMPYYHSKGLTTQTKVFLWPFPRSVASGDCHVCSTLLATWLGWEMIPILLGQTPFTKEVCYSVPHRGGVARLGSLPQTFHLGVTWPRLHNSNNPAATTASKKDTRVNCAEEDDCICIASESLPPPVCLLLHILSPTQSRRQGHCFSQSSWVPPCSCLGSNWCTIFQDRCFKKESRFTPATVLKTVERNAFNQTWRWTPLAQTPSTVSSSGRALRV